MDVALSDLLICPRCGPTYGLVLMPTESADRRVWTGVLGCANCRERYTIAGGVADLRTGGEAGAEPEAGGRAESTGEPAGRGIGSADPEVGLAGLMGLAEASGTVLVAGPAASHASALSALVEGVEVVAVLGPGPREALAPDGAATSPAPAEGPGPESSSSEPSPGVSRMRITTVLPFRTGLLRGLALTGQWSGLVEEGARVLGKEGRLVLDPAPSDAVERLEAAGLRVVAKEGGVVVAARRT